MSIGARIRVARQSRDWSQTDLAEKLGISQTAVHNWEADNTFPRPANLTALAGALGVTQRFLEDGDGGTALAMTVAEVLEAAKAEVARLLQTTPGRITLTLSMPA